MTTATLKTLTIVAALGLLSAGLAWADGPAAPDAAAPDAAAPAPAAGCGATQAVDTTDTAALAAWAYDHGFERVFTRSGDTSSATIACPAIIDCNATHCVETTTCAVTDTGATGCCYPSGACLICLNGTIKIERCRCQGGGCVNNPSQTFFCG